MKPRRPTHETRTARARREFWKRFGVWLFIIFFALGSAGLVIATSFMSAGKQ